VSDPRLTPLRAALEAHQTSDDREAGHLASMLALLERPGNHCSRSSFEPGHFTASGFVLAPDGSELLLVHHAKLGKWLQPGGHIEPEDADPAGAALREVFEETGLRDVKTIGLLDVDVHRFPERDGTPAHLHLDIRFGFRAASVDVVEGAGTTGVRWFPLSEVAAWSERPSMSRPARKLLRRVST
jgi:8-oxo-dGTP pyrophosphatase MutT (NUDIX family)